MATKKKKVTADDLLASVGYSRSTSGSTSSSSSSSSSSGSSTSSSSKSSSSGSTKVTGDDLLSAVGYSRKISSSPNSKAATTSTQSTTKSATENLLAGAALYNPNAGTGSTVSSSGLTARTNALNLQSSALDVLAGITADDDSTAASAAYAGAVSKWQKDYENYEDYLASYTDYFSRESSQARLDEATAKRDEEKAAVQSETDAAWDAYLERTGGLSWGVTRNSVRKAIQTGHQTALDRAQATIDEESSRISAYVAEDENQRLLSLNLDDLQAQIAEKESQRDAQWDAYLQSTRGASYGLTRESMDAALTQEIEELQSEYDQAYNLQWRATNAEKYAALSSEADYADNTDYRADLAARDTAYATINGDTTTQRGTHNSGGITLIDSDAKYDYMTDEERSNYNYLYNTQGADAAEEYLDYLTYDLNERRQSARYEKTATSADTRLGAVLGSIASVPANLASGVGAINLALQKAEKAATGDETPLDFNTAWQDPYVYSTAVRSTVAQNLDAAHGTLDESIPVLGGWGLGELYQTGMSMADSAALLAISKFTGLPAMATTSLLGGSAATTAMQDAHNKGLSDEQALITGLYSGVFESLFEEVSLDKLLKMKAGGSLATKLTNILTQAFTEGSEEFCTTAANTIADLIVNGDESEIISTYQSYLGQGLTSAQAAAQTLGTELNSAMSDFVGGAISGGLMGGGTMVSISLASRYENSNTTAGRQILSANTQQQLQELYNEVAQARATEGETAATVDLSGADAATVGQTYNDLQTDTQTAAVQERLEELGVSDTDGSVAQAIVLQAQGRSMTRTQEQLVKETEGAQQVYEEYASALAGEQTESNSWASQAALMSTGISALRGGSYARNAAAVQQEAARPVWQSEEETETAAAQTAATEEEQQDYTYQKAATATVKGSSDSVQVTGISYASSAENGLTVNVKAEDGSVSSMSASDITLPAQTQALVRAASAYGQSAPVMFAAIQDGQSVRDYSSAWQIGYALGAEGAPAANLARSGFYGEFGGQMELAYEEGQKQRKAKQARQTQRRKETRRKVKESAAKTKKSSAATVTMEGATLRGKTYAAVEEANLVPGQRRAIEATRLLAEAGVLPNVVFYETTAEQRAAKAPNGFYRDGTLYIDVNAWRTGDGIEGIAIMNTLAHELTHSLEGTAEYDALREFVFAHLSEEEQNAIRNSLTALGYSEAELNSEMVANACELVLRDSAAVRALAEENLSLFQKARNLVQRLVQKIRDAYNGSKGVTREAQAMVAYADELAQLWDDALLASQAREAGQEGTRLSLGQYDQHQIDNWANSKSIVVYQNEEQLKAFIQDAVDGKNLSKKMYFGTISSELADRIKAETGVDVAGYNCTLRATEIRKIFFDHGNESAESARGQRAITTQDILTIPEIVQNPDQIRLSEKLYQGKPVIIFAKKINGKTTIVSYVSQRHHDLRVQTMYSGKEKRNLAIGAGEQAPANTPEANDGTVPTHTVPRTADEVNTKFSLRDTVEETRDLIAVHNLTAENLSDSLDLGGLPMPSIAVVRDSQGHSKYGDISLIFRKESIDPQTDRRNHVYGGDAWTPTVPQVEYQVDSKASAKFEERIAELSRSVANGIFSSSSVLRSIGVDDSTSMSLDELARRLTTYDAVRAAYLADQGQTLEPVMKEKQFNRHWGNDVLQRFIDAAGIDTITRVAEELQDTSSIEQTIEPVREQLEQTIREAYEEEHRRFLDRRPESKQKRIDNYMQNNVTVFYLEDFIQDALAYSQHAGEPSSEIDRTATSDRLREAVGYDSSAVERMKDWLRPQLEDVLGERGIRNGKDAYTASGNRRSFASLHYAYTLENIVKAMTSDQKSRGQDTWGATAKTLMSVATPEYTSIDQVRADEGRLRQEDDETYQQALEAMDKELEEIITAVRRINKANSDNAFTEADIIGDVIMEAAQGTKTLNAIEQTFKKNGYSIGDTIARRIQGVYKTAAQMPTGYFEAKPERAVGFDEVAAAVVPDSTDPALITRLEEQGVTVRTYTAGDEQSRLEAVNADEDVKFSLRHVDGNDVVWLDDPALAGGTIRSRTAMEQYIRQHVGEFYRIIESGQKVYLGKELPSEYVHSKYTQRLRSTNQGTANAKNRAASGFGEMIEIATNRRWEQTRHPKSKDAAYGFYRYDTRFAFSSGTQENRTIHAYTAELVIRNASDGKKYLYDIVGLKKDTATEISLAKSEARSEAYRAGLSQSDVSTSDDTTDPGDVKSQLSRRTWRITDEELLSNLDRSTLTTEAERDAYSGWLRRYEAYRRFVDLWQEKQRQYAAVEDKESQQGQNLRRQVEEMGAQVERSLEQVQAFGDGRTLQQIVTRERNAAMARELAQQGVTEEQKRFLQDIQRQNRQLQRENNALRRDAQRTIRRTRMEVRQKDVQALARRLAADTSLKASDLTYDIASLCDYILHGESSSIEDGWSVLHDRSLEIAQQIVDASWQAGYDAIHPEVAALRGTTLQVPKALRSEVQAADLVSRARAVGVRLSYKTGQDLEKFLEQPGITSVRSDNLVDQLDDVIWQLECVHPLNPYGSTNLDLELAAEGLATSVLDNAMDVVSNARQFKSAADRALEQRKEAVRKANEKARKAMEQQHKKELQIRKEQRERAAENARKRQRQADLKEQEKAVKQATATATREAKAAQREADMAERAEQRERAKERREDRNARKDLLKVAKRLQSMKTTAANRAEIDALVGDLDTVAVSITGKTVERLSDLREWYEDQVKNNPDFIRDARTEETLKRLERKHISDMKLEDVRDLTDALRNIENEIRTQRRMIASQERRDTYQMGEQIIQDVEAAKGSSTSLPGQLKDMVVTSTLSPVRQVRRMTGWVNSDPLYVLTQELADGQRKMQDYQMRAESLFSQWTNDKKFIRRITGAHADELVIKGTGVEGGEISARITPAMRMSLYLHSRQEQNLRHIAEGGLTVPDMKLYKRGDISEAYARSTTIRLTPTQIGEIVEGMSPQERAFADAIHDYFNTMSRDEINGVSEQLKGYSLAGVEDYFPINTDSAFTRSEFESIKRDGTIEGMGFLKERVHATNPILLRDVNSVLTQSISMHAKYVGLAIPVRNINKALNVSLTSYSEDGTKLSFSGSVKSAIGQTWGKRGMSYIEKMLGDLQNPSSQDGATRALNKVRSNYAGAVLTINASVAMKQTASYPTAGAVLGFKPLALAMKDLGKVDLDLIAKYTPDQWYRSQGFSTSELGDIKTQDGIMNKVLSVKALNWVQGMDVLTTRKLWKASEYYVRDTQKELEVGSEDYYEAVARVYNQVIEETQPNYTTMQRPQLLRSDNALLQTLVMFKTQPFQNFNILYDATGNLLAKQAQTKEANTEENREAYQKAKQTFGRAVTSQLLQIAVFSAMTWVWAAFRRKDDKYKDEDGNYTFQSFLGAFAKDSLSSALSMIPFGSDVYELADSLLTGSTYYGFEAAVVSSINDALSAVLDIESFFADLTDPEADKSFNALWPKIDAIIDPISKMFGVPYENVANLFYAAVQNVAEGVAGEYVGQYTAMRMQKSISTKSSDYYDLLFESMSDEEQYNAIRNDLISSGLVTEEEISNAMLSRMSADVVDAVDTGEGLEERISQAVQLTEEGVVDADDLSAKIISGLFDEADEGEVNLYDAYLNDRELYEQLVDQFVSAGLVEQEDIGSRLYTESKESLYEALEVNVSEYMELMADLVGEGADYLSIESGMRSMYDAAIEADPTYTLPQTSMDYIREFAQYAQEEETEETYSESNLTESQLREYVDTRTSYTEEYRASIEASSVWRNATDKQKDQIATAYQNIARQKALYEASGGESSFSSSWYETAAVDAPKHGVSTWQYILAYRYKQTLSGDDVKEQFTAWLDRQSLTSTQKEWILSNFYKG